MEMKKRIRNVAVILSVSVVVGSLLLLLIYLLPVESARAHVADSLYQMLEIRNDPEGDVLRKRIVGLKENFTDSLMVQNALEKVEGKSAWDHAMYVYHHDLGNESTWRTEDSLAAFLRQGTEGMYLREYSRYWHGYLVYLKPLLMCMSWKHVEVFLVVFQAALLLAALILAWRRKRAFLGLGILCTFLFMKPLQIWFSLTLSDCWSIAMAAVIVLLLFYDRIEKKNWQEEVFLLTGILTAYIDFLTYPIVTLGVPLCVWLVMSMGAKEWRRQLCRTFWNCVCWAVGYVGMWGMKWVVAELTCHSGTLRNAAWAVIFRTSPLDGYSSFFSGVSRAVRDVMLKYDAVAYKVAFGLLVLLTLVAVVWCLLKARSASWGVTVGCLAVVALFPFGWLVFAQNHTAIHRDYTFRIFGVTVMALWCIMISSVLTIRKSGHKTPDQQKK